MSFAYKKAYLIWMLIVALTLSASLWATDNLSSVGREIAVERHLQDGEEYGMSIPALIRFGERLFKAKWTIQEGAGRPLSKGTGASISDVMTQLTFPRNFNRVSGPEANSCSGCHNEPYVGGAGDRATEVFVLGQRFDFATFDHDDGTTMKGALDERGTFATLQNIANERKTVGMFGSGFIEMLARQITSDLQSVRDATQAGSSRPLVSKGISFGTIRRNFDGTWDTSQVQGLPETSLTTSGANAPPTLMVLPFQQAGSIVSLRQFTINAFNHHHGMQAEERFGIGVDADADGFSNELTRADITAVTVFQATLPVPGQVIPDDREIESAVREGEVVFRQIGCATCHIPEIPLTDSGWIFTEPNPFNPPGNLRPGDSPSLAVDLTREDLPKPRLTVVKGIVMVPAFTDLKLHDICDGASDPNAEALDQNAPVGSATFFSGNTKFLTRKLWGIANEGPFMHHGKFTTMREAVLAHSGEAKPSRVAFQNLSDYERDAIVEFLKSLQVLPPGTPQFVVNEKGEPKTWTSRN